MLSSVGKSAILCSGSRNLVGKRLPGRNAGGKPCVFREGYNTLGGHDRVRG